LRRRNGDFPAFKSGRSGHYQACVGTMIVLLIFHRLAGWLPHMKTFGSEATIMKTKKHFQLKIILESGNMPL